MRNLGVLIISLLITSVASAQKVYFIYLQSENASTFYVKLDEKIQTASSGYLILPQLKDSAYTLAIGSSEIKGELRFSIKLSGKDQGFLIKKFDYGFALFNLQTLNVVKPLEDISGSGGTSVRKKEDEFTALLSKAANDTSLLYTLVFEAEKTEPTTNKQAIAGNQSAVPLPNNSQSTGDTSALTGTIVWNDKSFGGDTVALQLKAGSTASIMPSDSSAWVKNESVAVDSSQKDNAGDLAIIGKHMSDSIMTAKAATDSVAKDVVLESKSQPDPLILPKDTASMSTLQPINESTSEYKKSVVKKHAESSTSEGFGLVFYDAAEDRIDTIKLIIPNPKLSLQVTRATDDSTGMLERISTSDQQAKQKRSEGRSTCRSEADHTDFLKLRRDMASRETEESMMAVAKKGFKNKCFTTEQVKNLSNLFLTQAGKYNFFDLAFSHTSDPQSFSILQGELVDAYFASRFKALIGQ